MDDTVTTAVEHTRDDLRRVDATAGACILTLIGLGTIIAEIGGDLPRSVALAAAAATVPAAGTIALALAVVWPRITDAGFAPGAWPHAAHERSWSTLRDSYAAADPEEVQARQLWTLARIVATKVRWLRRATLALATTIGVLGATALYGTITALI